MILGRNRWHSVVSNFVVYFIATQLQVATASSLRIKFCLLTRDSGAHLYLVSIACQPVCVDRACRVCMVLYHVGLLHTK